MAFKHDESQQPDNKPLSHTRRTALKKMLVGSGVAAGAAALPAKWAKPVVDKVLVPAHAQTSTTTTTTTLCPELPANYRGEITIVEEEESEVSLWNTLKEAVIPRAYAGTNPDDGVADLCIQVSCDPATGNITFESKLSINQNNQGFYLTGNGEVGGQPAIMTDQSDCASDASILVSAVDPDKVKFSIAITMWRRQWSSATTEIGPDDGCPEPPPDMQRCQ